MPSLLKRVPEIFRDSQDYIHTRIRNLEYKRSFDNTAKPVREWLKNNGKEDADGNLVYEFPRAIHAVDNKQYAGVMLRKTSGRPYMVEDEVRELLGSHVPGAVNCKHCRVFKKVEVMDDDEIYALQQEGIISEEQLRGLIHYTDPSYALWPVEATVVLEEEE